MAVKTAKRILKENVGTQGKINTDTAARAILQYRNTPLQDCNLSPAQILFHRQLRDTIPAHPSQYHLHPEWTSAAMKREISYHEKNRVVSEGYNMKARALAPLQVGTHVVVQGGDKKWSKQGKIIEFIGNRQYHVKLLGSGRITLRNRRFLRAEYITTDHRLLKPTNRPLTDYFSLTDFQRVIIIIL